MIVRKSSTRMIGLTLLESLFALAVSAFVLIAGMILYKSIILNADVNQVMGDMNTIKLGYKNYLGSGYQFNATTDAAQLQAVKDAGFLPSTLNDPWGSSYVVSLSWNSGYITIAIPGLNSADPNNSSNAKDYRCQAIWEAAKTTGALSAVPSQAGNMNCAFLYRFP